MALNSIHDWNFLRTFRMTEPDEAIVPLPALFKQAGYAALGFGKTYHDVSCWFPPGDPKRLPRPTALCRCTGKRGCTGPGNYDQPLSWSTLFPYFAPGHLFNVTKNNQTREHQSVDTGCDPSMGTVPPGGCLSDPQHGPVGQCHPPTCGQPAEPPAEMAPVQDDVHTEAVLESLAKLKQLGFAGGPDDSRPFFLALGLHKPHTDYYVNDSFLARFPAGSVGESTMKVAPQGMPPVAFGACPLSIGSPGQGITNFVRVSSFWRSKERD